MLGSVLDETGDVKLYIGSANDKYVSRDNVCHGLDLHKADNGVDVHRDGNLVAHIRRRGDRQWVAVWVPSGKTAVRHDTWSGLVAKLARMLLHPATCCKEASR